MSKLLATIETLKAECHIEGAVEPKKFKPAVLDAQRVHVQEKIGTRLYELFLNAVDESTGALTGLTETQETFYSDYLIPMLAKYVEAEYSFHSTYQRTNIGTVKAGSDRVDKQKAASHEEVKYLYEMSKDKGDSLAQRAINFILLKENKADLGDLYNDCDQNLPPTSSGFSSPIYTGPR